MVRKRSRWWWLQHLTGIHRVHHPRWSYGWTLPITAWVYFPAVQRKNHDTERMETVRYGWKKCVRDSYHDCTESKIY